MTNLRFQRYDMRLTKKKRYFALMKIVILKLYFVNQHNFFKTPCRSIQQLRQLQQLILFICILFRCKTFSHFFQQVLNDAFV